MANGIIKNMYLVTENGKNYLELDLIPMNNGTTNVAVMSKLTYFDGNTEKDVQVLKEDTADVTYNNVTNSYKYPSKIRIPIEGKPSTIKLNTFASSTLFGTDKHENIAVLSVKYPKENAVITADKKQLNALFEATTSKYYDSWNNVFKNANVTQDMAVIKNFGNKINAAQNVLKNNIASTEEISTAFTELSDLKNQYDLLIQLRTSNAEAVANFNSDKDSKNYSEESINAVDNYLQGKIDKLEDLVHNNPKSNEILKLFNDVQRYYNLLRYDTSKLDTAIKSAQDKLAASNYSDESKNNLTTAITKATEFINKAKETRNLEDTRSSLLKEIEDAVNKLKETPAPEVNKPSDNTQTSNNETNKPNDKVDTPANSEVNKPNDKVDTPSNDEANKPVESTDEVAKKLATERANLLLPLETAKILVNDDKDKEGINKEAHAKLKEATEKAQKVYDEEKSIDKILEEKSNIDKALEEYTKHKNDKETVPGNNKPEDKPTPDNKPDNNSSNNVPEFNRPVASNGQDAPVNKVPEFNGPVASNGQDTPVNKVPEFNGPVASNGQDAPVNKVPEFNGPVASNGQDAPVNKVPEFNGPVASNGQDAPVNKVPEFNGPAASNGQDAPVNKVPEFNGPVASNGQDAPVNEVPEFNGPAASNGQDAPVNEVPEFNGPAASNGQDAPVNEVPEFTGGVNDTTPPTVPDKPEGETPKPTKPETSNGDSLVQPEIPEFKGGVNAVEAAVNEIPTFGAKQPEIKKILDELVNIKNQIKDSEENGAEGYYINGLKDRFEDLEKEFNLLTQNLSAVNEVPEYTGPVTPEPQSHLEGTAPGSGQGGTAGEIVDPNQNLGSVGGASATQDVDFGQTPAVTQLSAKPEEAKPAKAKSKALASTGMNSSSTTALGLSLICLVGLVVRRKLLK